MQSQLKTATRAVRVWRALALASSASALTLALWAKPARLQPVAPQSTAPVAATQAPSVSDLPPLSQVNAVRDSGDVAALEALIAIANRGEPKLASAALQGIAQIGGDRAREFLARRFAAATDAELPDHALALAALGDAPARALLTNAARSTRPMARSAMSTTAPKVRSRLPRPGAPERAPAGGASSCGPASGESAVRVMPRGRWAERW